MIPVKICGITNLADAELAVEHGTSAIGFIFYEKSPRATTIQVAKTISERLSASISKVGVFVSSFFGPSLANRSSYLFNSLECYSTSW